MLDHCDFHVGSFHFACHHDDNHNTIHIVSSHRLFTSSLITSSSPMSYPCGPCGGGDHQMVHQQQQVMVSEYDESTTKCALLCVSCVFDMGLAGCCARSAFVRNKRHTHTMCLFFRTKARENARMRECKRSASATERVESSAVYTGASVWLLAMFGRRGTCALCSEQAASSEGGRYV